MNTGRVIAGGLVAGVVINIGETLLNTVVLADEMQALNARFNLPPMTAGTIGGFVVMCFVLGLLAVWLYAAVRPRLGPGPKTAAIVALAIWIAAYLFPTISSYLMGFFPGGVTTFVLGWGLVEVIAGTIAGAYVYREEGTARHAVGV